ncbi:MAG: glycosyltransferase, partial [Dolichospermum sp.]
CGYLSTREQVIEQLDQGDLFVLPSYQEGLPKAMIEAKEKYDIVHVHTPVAAFVTRYALKNLKKRLNTKVIYTAHGFHFYQGGKALKAYCNLNRPETCLVFAGDGVLMEEMQQLAIKLNIQNQVRFLGIRRDIPILMRTAVATILVSEQEGLPRCVMEAMSLETPVIGTNIRGTRDLLENGCGLLVEVGDIEGITKAMTWILDHPERAIIISKKGREKIINYDINQVIKMHNNLYNCLQKIK